MKVAALCHIKHSPIDSQHDAGVLPCYTQGGMVHSVVTSSRLKVLIGSRVEVFCNNLLLTAGGLWAPWTMGPGCKCDLYSYATDSNLQQVFLKKCNNSCRKRYYQMVENDICVSPYLSARIPIQR